LTLRFERMLTVRGALVSLALASLAGCGGASSNAEWVRTAEAGAVVGDAHVAFEHDASAGLGEAATSTDSDELDPSSGRQRLSRTITLGEVVAMPPSAAPAAQGSGTTVIVNVTNQTQPAYVPVYGGYGYGYGAVALGSRGGSRPSPSPHAASAPIIPGQSWPAAPSYGPSFPYSTSPASPWQHQR
jgi:hypothetical protein